MTRFDYTAKDWSGKLVKGVLDMGSKEEVLSSIRDGGLVPLSIEKEAKSGFDEITKKLFGRVGLKQISTFTRQLSTMMTAGLPMTDALNLLKNQTDGGGTLFEIIDYTLNTVRGGQSLAEGLKKYQNIFGEAYIASIEAGESGGVLEEVLMKLADNLEKENEFKGKVKGAMIYPVIVTVAMLIVAFIMLVFVIPKLMGLYNDLGAKMPLITQIMLTASKWAQKLWFLFPLIIFGGFSVYKIGMQNPDFRLKKDEIMLKLPVMGNLTVKTVMANTTRTLSMLLGAGISIVDALRIAAQVSGNEAYAQAYTKISERVQKGFSISSSFEEETVFPLIVNQMIATGEATGKLSDVLIRVSNYFSMEAEQSVKALTSAIEPIIMVVLGISVGFLVIAVIMPIYNLTSAF